LKFDDVRNMILNKEIQQKERSEKVK